MFKYLVLFLLLIGAVYCNEGENPAGAEAPVETPPVPAPSRGPNRVKQLKNLGTGLFDLGLISAKHLSNLGREAMPLFDKAGRALGNEAVGLAKNFQSSEFAQNTVKAVEGHPTAQQIKPYASAFNQGLQKLKPYAAQGAQKLKPLVNDGIKAASPILDHLNANGRKLWAGHRDRISRLHKEYNPPPPPPPAPEGGEGVHSPSGPQ